MALFYPQAGEFSNPPLSSCVVIKMGNPPEADCLGNGQGQALPLHLDFAILSFVL